MPWNKQLSNLRNVLADRYWRVEEARRIVLEVGMNPIFIEFSNSPINTWQSILERADQQGKVGDIISTAHQENPHVEALALAEQGLLHLAVEPPPLTDVVWRGPKDPGQLEQIIGMASTLRPISFLQRGLEVSKAVGRIVLSDGSRGTGFLVKDNLLITNHHVIPTATAAEGATVEFNFEKTVDGLDAPIDSYRLAPGDVFVTSPNEDDGGDDWTAVRVRGDANARWGGLPLGATNPRVQDEVIIVQHPWGGSKQIALSHNVIAFVSERRLQYLTDTLEGSSGSPVFNVDWQVVAVHHRGGWLRDPNTKGAVYRNQGIHINVVSEGLGREGLL